MSKAPDASGEGVSRWKQRQAAKAMMYAMSNERSGDAIVIDPERDVDRYLDLAGRTVSGSWRSPRPTSMRTSSPGLGSSPGK